MAKIQSSLHKKFGDKIKALRDQKGITQEDLAEKIEVDRSYMGFVERGERNPTLDVLGRIAKAFGISLSKLFENV